MNRRRSTDQPKRRLADEFDAAQDRGEVRKDGQRGKAVPDKNSFSPATTADVGLSRKEARQIRDAEKRDPGIVRRTVNAAVAAGKEPTKARIREAIAAAAAVVVRLPSPPLDCVADRRLHLIFV
jgi:hypothetical protein